MSQPNLREIIKSEYKKCIEDPIYFIKKYVKIQHPVRGTVNFELYPFQESTLKDFVENSLNIVLKSRQMGISTLTSAYSLWLMTFHSDKNILCISITQETAKEIVTKVRFANDNLPAWLKVPCIEDNRLSLRLKNGSQIKAVSSAGTAGRSTALSLLIIDECLGFHNTIYIRNKLTGEVKPVNIGELYEQKEYI
jgi:phage terminase large subunit-like protein